MNNIAEAFNKKKVLITYITGGDPNLELTKKIIRELDQFGVDIIEVGIPFSDPLADGPIIQAASQRALENGVTLDLILRNLKAFKDEIQSPIVLMGYYNSILSYGREKFINDLGKSGVDGVIIPDLPYEEDPDFYSLLSKQGLAGILLVSPNTSETRLQEIAGKSTGFLYCVSLLGVTGDRPGSKNHINTYIKRVSKYSYDLPLALGFGIDDQEKVKRVINDVDGVVIGSALINIINKSRNEEEIMKNIREFVNGIKEQLMYPLS